MYDQHKQVKSRQERDREDADKWRSLLSWVRMNADKKQHKVSVYYHPDKGGYAVQDYYQVESSMVFNTLEEAVRDAIEIGQAWEKSCIPDKLGRSSGL